MKRLIRWTALVCCSFLLLGWAAGCAPANEEKPPTNGVGISAGTAQNDVRGTTFTKVASQGDVILSVNKDTCAIQLENLGAGIHSLSNSEEALIDLERAQFVLTYLDKKGVTSTMNSYSDSVKNGQYQIETLENGVKITFTCGEYLERLLFPYAIAPENFEAVTGAITNSFEKTYVTSRYKLTDIQTVTTQTEKEALLKRYPALSTQKLYILKQDNPNVSVRRELHRLFASAGYGEDDYLRDMEYAVSSEAEGQPYFTFSVYYTLEGSHLCVRIPVNEIIEANGGNLLQLAVLPYMDTPAEEIGGEYLLPDGAGSLMRFRNGKQGVSSYETVVYGGDISNQATEQLVNLLPCYLPVIGCLRDDHTLMTYASEGAAFATVRAVSGSHDTAPQAYFEYAIRPSVRTKLASDGRADGFTTVSEDRYDGDIVVEYSLYEKGTGYSELAAVMRDRLFGESTDTFTPSPLAVNLVGTAEEERSLFGVKYRHKNVFTTIRQAAEIRDELKKTIPNLTVRLSGFINGGMQQQLRRGIQPEGGSETELAALLAQERCYLSGDTLLVRTNGLFDCFHADSDSAYTLENLPATYKDYNPATFQMDFERYRYILSVSKVQETFSLLMNGIQKLNAKGVAINDGAALLGADYSRKHPTDRQAMADAVSKQLAAAAEGVSVLVDGANEYAIPHVSAIANLHLTSSKFDVCDESVPFLPMVLCGHVDYFGFSMNTVSNDLTSFLQAVESGAGLYYTLTANEDENFSKTDFDEYFSTKFSVWKEDIGKRADELQTLFAKRGRTITRHEKLAEKVYKTVYDNGFYTVVNYGTASFEQEGLSVPALGYSYGTGGTHE